MKIQIFTQLRLSYFLPLLSVLFYVIISDLVVYEASTLTYFITVLSILGFAFFVSPLLSNSRRKIDGLLVAVRSESAALFRIAAKSRELSSEISEEFKLMLSSYVMTKAGDYTPESAQKEYFELINFALLHSKTAVGQEIVDMLYQNEDNRSEVSMYLRSHIYAHEWIVSIAFYLIGVSGLLLVGTVSNSFEHIGLAILAAAITYPLIMLKKFDDSTHKHAQQVWGPFSRLIETGYRELN